MDNIKEIIHELEKDEKVYVSIGDLHKHETQEHKKTRGQLAEFKIEVKEEFSKVNNRLDNVEARLDNVEARLDKIEARLDNVEARLDRIEARLDSMDKKFDNIEYLLKMLINKK